MPVRVLVDDDAAPSLRLVEVEPEWLDEATIAWHIARHRWGDDDGVPVCPHCGRRLWQSRRRVRLFGCSAHPSFRVSVTSGTFLHGTKLELWVLFQMMAWLISDDPPSSYDLARRVGVNRKTAFLWRQKIMAAIALRGDPIVGIVQLVRLGVATCGPQPVPVPLHAEAHPYVARFAQRRYRRFPVSWWADRHTANMQGGLEPDIATALGIPPEETPLVWPGGLPLLVSALAVQSEISHVHLGVSVRWLPRYLQFMARRSGFSRPESVLDAMVDESYLSLAALRPGGAPRQVLDDRFLPVFEDVATFENGGARPAQRFAAPPSS